jgi:hypothetical protein
MADTDNEVAAAWVAVDLLRKTSAASGPSAARSGRAVLHRRVTHVQSKTPMVPPAPHA